VPGGVPRGRPKPAKITPPDLGRGWSRLHWALLLLHWNSQLTRNSMVTAITNVTQPDERVY
jgi:hypothetical protein